MKKIIALLLAFSLLLLTACSEMNSKDTASTDPVESELVTSGNPEATVSKSKIWLLTEKKYVGDSGERYEYDSEGKLIALISYNENIETQKIVYEYDDNDVVSKISSYLQGEPNGVIICECDSKGFITKMTTETSDVEYDTIHLEYNDIGLITKLLFYADDVVIGDMVFVHDDKGNLISYTEKYMEQDPYTENYEYTFDDKGRTKEMKQGSVKTEYEYDENDNIIKSSTYLEMDERDCKYSYASFEVPSDRVNWFKNQLEIFKKI